MITPTVGRIVWYYPDSFNDRELGDFVGPLAAIVTAVKTDTLINMAVFDPIGRAYGRQTVDLYQGEGERPVSGDYAEWMPYQKGQAAKTEAMAAQIAANIPAAPPAA